MSQGDKIQLSVCILLPPNKDKIGMELRWVSVKFRWTYLTLVKKWILSISDGKMKSPFDIKGFWRCEGYEIKNHRSAFADDTQK